MTYTNFEQTIVGCFRSGIAAGLGWGLADPYLRHDAHGSFLLLSGINLTVCLGFATVIAVAASPIVALACHAWNRLRKSTPQPRPVRLLESQTYLWFGVGLGYGLYGMFSSHAPGTFFST